MKRIPGRSIGIATVIVLMLLITKVTAPALTWQTETVDSAGNLGWFNFLALDTNGTPHISYYDSTNEDLKYANKTGKGGVKVERVAV